MDRLIERQLDRQKYGQKVGQINRWLDTRWIVRQMDNAICTGCPDQIGRNFKITFLHNQMTYRKFKDMQMDSRWVNRKMNRYKYGQINRYKYGQIIDINMDRLIERWID